MSLKAEILGAFRRQRHRWLGTLVIWGTAGFAVAVFIALMTVVDSLFLKEPFEGAEHVAVLGRPHERFGTSYEMTREDIAEASVRLAVPVAAMARPSPLGRSPYAPLATQVSTNFFDVIRVRAIAGRTFSSLDSGVTTNAVISEALWRARFGGLTDIIGSSIVIGDSRLTIVGVVPATFGVPSGTSVWVPHPIRSTIPFVYRALVWFQDETSASAVMSRLASWRSVSMRAHLAPRDASHALVLLAAGGLLLFAVWTYLGLLQAGEAVRRIGEFRLRIALGASTPRAIRAMVIEGYASLAVCLVAGVLLAPTVLTWLVATLPPDLLAGRPVGLGDRAVGTVVSVLVVGFLVVTAIALPSAVTSIKAGMAGNHGIRQSRRAGRSTRWIVAAQFAIATPILYVLGLAGYSFHALVATDVGYRLENIFSVQVPAFPAEQFSFEVAARHVTNLHGVLDRVASIPGVAAVALSSDRLGFSPTGGRVRVRLGGASSQEFVIAQRADVSAEYFELLGIPTIAGQTFVGRSRSDVDWKNVYGGVVIDSTLAAQLGNGADVIGRELIVNFTPATILGVVRQIRSRRPDEPVESRVYLPLSPAAPFATNLLVRCAGSSEPVRRAVSAAVKDHFNTPAPADTVLLTDELLRVQESYRGPYELLSLMGWIGIVLCVAGVFGVGTYAVGARRRELAIRMAVGASRWRILWVSQRDLLVASTIGMSIGLTVGILLGRAASSRWFAVTPMDPLLIAGLMALFVFSVLIGAALPIRDAWRTEVSSALRDE